MNVTNVVIPKRIFDSFMFTLYSIPVLLQDEKLKFRKLSLILLVKALLILGGVLSKNLSML